MISDEDASRILYASRSNLSFIYQPKYKNDSSNISFYESYSSAARLHDIVRSFVVGSTL